MYIKNMISKNILLIAFLNETEVNKMDYLYQSNTNNNLYC